MRVAVLYDMNGSERVRDAASAMARGIESQGHQVTIFNMETDTDAMLTIYEYIVVGTAPTSFLRSTISGKIADFLKNAGKVSGTRSYAFLIKKGFFANKSLQLLMKSMEQEGMFLKVSDIIGTKEEAEYIGKKLRIK